MSFLVLRDSARAVSKARSDLSFRCAMNPVHVLLDEGHVGIDKIKFKKGKGFLEPQANPAASYLRHGYAIGQRLQQISKEFFYVHQGSLYPGLHRLEDKGWLQAKRRESETGRQAKFYSLTRKGRRHMDAEVVNWGRLCEAVSLILLGSFGMSNVLSEEKKQQVIALGKLDFTSDCSPRSGHQCLRTVPRLGFQCF
jgi:PadR family transcriptional regulator PadR